MSNISIVLRPFFANFESSSWSSWRRQWHPTPVLLPGESPGRRSLVGCSPWGCEELDTTERLHFHALEKEMATHSRVLAWRIPGMGEPGGLPSIGLHRVGHDWSDLAAAAAWSSIPSVVCGSPLSLLFSPHHPWSHLIPLPIPQLAPCLSLGSMSSQSLPSPRLLTLKTCPDRLLLCIPFPDWQSCWKKIGFHLTFWGRAGMSPNHGSAATILSSPPLGCFTEQKLGCDLPQPRHQGSLVSCGPSVIPNSC